MKSDAMNEINVVKSDAMNEINVDKWVYGGESMARIDGHDDGPIGIQGCMQRAHGLHG